MPDIPPVSGRSLKRESGICVLLVLVSAGMRLLFLAEYRSSPTFEIPIVDSASYDQMARSLIEEGRFDPEFFWHGFLYPVFLTLVYAVSGGMTVVARIVQSALAGLTATGVFFLGRRLFDEKTGLLAGLITALYGPLIFFDTALLSTGIAVMIAPLLVLAALKADSEVNPLRYIIFGICAGLAILCRATFIPYIVSIFVLLSVGLRGKSLSWRIISVREGLAAVSMLVVLLPVALASGRITGHYSPLPRSGSINIYIGNNTDTDRTMASRPGPEWRKILNMPEREGRVSEKEYRQYFMDRYIEYVTTQPASFLSGMAGKTLRFFSSREIPRNYDIYTVSSYSKLLKMLTWKIWKIGFPFGLLLPLAILGLYFHRKSLPSVFLAFVILYPAAIIAVFTSARLRAPVIPVLAIPAAAGLISFTRILRENRMKAAVAVAGAIILIMLASSLYGPYVTEEYDYRAELHTSVAFQLSLAGRHVEAVKELESALEFNPEFLPAHRILGCVLQEQGKEEEALAHFETVLRDDPDAYLIHYYMGVALLNHGRVEEGVAHLKKAADGARRSRDRMLLVQVEQILGRD